MPKKNTSTPSIEEALNEINTIIEKMESSDSNLETSLEQFERGIQLIKHCQKTLKTAEQKVQKLIDKNGKSILEAFDEGTNDEESDDE